MGLALHDLRGDQQRMLEIASAAAARNMKDNDAMEIFAARYVFSAFYEQGSLVCFELKQTFDPNRETIRTLEQLKKAAEKDTLMDFAILSNEQLRTFQLKAYRDKLGDDELFEFIKYQLGKYGNQIGDANLLVTLQGGGDISQIDFEKLHERLRVEGFTFGGEILVAYNENNETSVINRVYPDLGTARTPIQWHDPDSVPRPTRPEKPN